VTRSSYCSPPINNLNGVCKKDQIDHKLQKLEPFWTFWKNEEQTKQSHKYWKKKKVFKLNYFFSWC